jgi:hypothetical protein
MSHVKEQNGPQKKRLVGNKCPMVSQEHKHRNKGTNETKMMEGASDFL